MPAVSLGNDIIDLKDPDTVNLTQKPKFLRRVYHPEELKAIEAFETKEQNRRLWKLWALKEAAYKAIKRLDPETIFTPRGIRFYENPGQVIFNKKVCFVEVRETSEYIHASSGFPFKNFPQPTLQTWIGSFQEIKQLLDSEKWSYTESYSEESTLCRNYAAYQIQNHLKCAKVEIVKSGPGRQGVPEVWIDQKKTSHLISTSHHGRFCAVLFFVT